MRIVIFFLFIIVQILSAENKFLTANVKDVVKTVNSRLCAAGQVKILEYNQEEAYIKAKMLKCIGSSDLHPNNIELGEIKIVDQKILGSFQVGKTYCMILTNGSMLGMTIIAYSENVPLASKEIDEIMKSEEAFQNSKEWQKRRTLWREFKKNRTSEKAILAYCENDSLTTIFYFDERYSYHQFSLLSKKEKTYYPQKGSQRPGNISFKDGLFTAWKAGEIVMQAWEMKE